MDDATENRYSMFLGVDHFLNEHSATLAVNPAIIALKDEFKLLLEDIGAQASLASMKVVGYTEAKTNRRSALIDSSVKVSSALFAYWLFTGAKNELKPVDYSERSLKRKTDSNLYLRATQLHVLADPVKALLAPYNCTPADVDALLTCAQQFLTDVEMPRKTRKDRAEARKKMMQHMKQGTAILHKLDIHLATFISVNRTLHYQYTFMRAVVDRHGKRKTKNEIVEQPES